MGMYTELKFEAKIDPNAKEVIELLDSIVNHGDEMFERIKGFKKPSIMSVYDEPELPIDHPFGKTPRWNMLFWGEGAPWFKNNTLHINSNFKNYDNELDLFFDWIKPYLDEPKGKFIGRSLYEQDNIWTIYEA